MENVFSDQERAAMAPSQLIVGSVLSMSMFVSGFSSIAVAQQDNAVAGEGEKIIKAAPPPKVEWSDADRALRDAMEAEDGLTQEAAIARWKQLLERDDLAEAQQVFAWWRIGSLHGYQFDPTDGGSSDYEKAKRAFAKVRELLGERVTHISLNSASMWGSIRGSEKEEAKRLATAFNWVFTRNSDDIDRSAKVTNAIGYLIDKKFFPRIAHRESSLGERKQFLRGQLAERRRILNTMVTDKIQYGQDSEAITELLESIEDVADPKQMEKWRAMQAELGDNP